MTATKNFSTFTAVFIFALLNYGCSSSSSSSNTSSVTSSGSSSDAPFSPPNYGHWAPGTIVNLGPGVEGGEWIVSTTGTLVAYPSLPQNADCGTSGSCMGTPPQGEDEYAPDTTSTAVNSVGGGTKDVDLQAQQGGQAAQTARAQAIANEFGMDEQKALELTRISDQLKSLARSNQITVEDQQALSERALTVTGISVDQVNAAITDMAQSGNTRAADSLVDQAAQNLGMPSSAGLRDQILPALGIRY